MIRCSVGPSFVACCWKDALWLSLHNLIVYMVVYMVSWYALHLPHCGPLCST